MTTEEVNKRLDEFITRRHQLLQKVEKAARAVVPVLLDAERKNSAAELQQLFFEIDANDQETNAFIGENSRQALEAMLAKFQK